MRKNRRKPKPAPVPEEETRATEVSCATVEPRPAEPPHFPLIIREPQTEDDLSALHLLMLLQGREMAPVEPDAVMVLQKLLVAAANPHEHCMLMAIRDGRLVGHLCIEKVGYWFAQGSFLRDFGFFVLPKHRGEDVGKELLRAARAVAKGASLPLYISILNPKRRRGIPTGMERAASTVGYVPTGAVLAFGGEPSTRMN
jgi:GNAT superfamily N-acetyltransferase